MLKKYVRKVNYYETDAMQVVHHSNYFRYFEEARVLFLDEIGYPYARIEEEGIISPIVSFSCDYIKPLVYDQEFEIELYITKNAGTNFEVEYKIYSNNELHAQAKSRHCYLNDERKIVSIKKENRAFFDLLQQYVK